VINKIKSLWKLAREVASEILPGQEGSILGGVILTVVTIVVLGAIVPSLWPMMTATSESIAALNGTDVGTVFLKSGWPVAILIIGIGIVVALIYFALRQFGILGGKRI
jgi:hypothetical protein